MQAAEDLFSQHYRQIQALSPINDASDNVIEPSMPLGIFLSLSLFIFFFVIVLLGFLPLMFGRFRDMHHFKTAFLLAFIGGALPLTIGLLFTKSDFLTRAAMIEIPYNLRINTSTAKSFRVEWKTAGEQYGALRYGFQATPSMRQRTVLEVNGLARRTEHTVVVNELPAGEMVYFEILSGTHWYDNQGQPLTVQILP